MDRLYQLEQEVGRLRRELADTSNEVGRLQPPTISSPDSSFVPIPTSTLPSASNLIRNSEISHSVNTWFQSTPSSNTDVGKEAAYWFSHDAPSTGQTLNVTTDARSSSTNNALKAYIDDGGVHSTYNNLYCDWDRQKGEVRLTGTKTLDAPFSHNRIATPSRSVVYLTALIARRNSTISFQSNTHIFAGIWDQAAKDWLRGTPFAVTATIRGTVTGGIERRYRIRAFTDRGYEYLSSEATVALAPSNFNTADVQLTWKLIPGILRYEVYRFTPSTGAYELLADDIVGATYIDNGRVVKAVGSYPSATDTTPGTYVATTAMVDTDVAVDGDPWSTLRLNISVPDDYDQTLTISDQVIRIGLTKALDRKMTDAVATNGLTTIESATAAFTSLDNRRVVTLTNGTDTLTTSMTYQDADTAVLDVAWPYASGTVTMRVIEGGDHGILMDIPYACYVANSAYAPFPDDLNRAQNGGQNPIAAPRSSSQGGSGQTGPILPTPGGGGIGCVALDTPIGVWVGHLEAHPWESVRRGEAVFSGGMVANTVLAKHYATTEDLHIVVVKGNWLYDVVLECSDRHPVLTGKFDYRGVPANMLKVGDSVLVYLDGKIVQRPVRMVISTDEFARVGTFQLSPHFDYWAGQPKFRTRLHEIVAKIFKRRPIALIASHNVKREGDLPFIV